ncbi:pirin family protein [Agaribacterium haliotis]|uniref:pirin family protein n=1 Tax=Agaribacterium haliotis TaxID=2013869 RepID=UPI000BB53A12|nr:pirin family protein [Agaribacterium haliotis]
MQILQRDSLPLGGFAGLKEHRIVTDSRVFGARKNPQASEGLGNFVYLADARFQPHGETGMHPHKEIDVISVMVEGRVSHEGSLEHGTSLEQGHVQAQRAGGEGFAHNEINPDSSRNRMIQLWVVPEESGRPAGYHYYKPQNQGKTRIYGGDKQQQHSFDSHTLIDIVRLKQGQSIDIDGDSLHYITAGKAEFSESGQSQQAGDGSLVRANKVSITALSDCELISVTLMQEQG